MALTKVIGAGVGNLDELGVGTASPSYKLHSVTTSGSDYAGFFHNSAGSGNGTALVVKGGANNTGAGTLIVQDYSGNTDLMVDGNGHVTMPNQSAFLATLSGTQSAMAVGSAVTIQYVTEIYDQNADYNNSAYTFTAPVTGKYLLNFSAYGMTLDSAATYYESYLNTSNRNYYFTIDPDFGQDNAYHSFVVTALADMDASDTVSVKMYQSGGSSQTTFGGSSHFSGYLVC